MIPVFTVIKNGAILKNIFIVNKSLEQHSSSSSIKLVDNSENLDRNEEILIVGRHPDCNIVLMHPSISRFHLQINSNPTLQKLFVTDLSSVHGTWVSEKKIEPGFRVEMKEGDTIRMGGSTRVYRLHWIPLNRAFDSENPFVSESDLALIWKKEEGNIDSMSQKNIEEKDTSVELDKAEERNQDIDIFGYKKEEIQYMDSILEDVVSLFPDENLGLILKDTIPSSTSVDRNSFHASKEEIENSSTNDNELSLKATRGVMLNEKISPSISAGMNFFHGGKEEMENVSTNDNELSLKSVGGVILQTLTAIFYDCNQSPEYLSADEDSDIPWAKRLELESQPEKDSRSQTTTDSVLTVETVQSSLPAGELSDNDCTNKEDQYLDEIPAESKQLNHKNASDDNAEAAELLVETQNLSPLREPTTDYMVAIELTEGIVENQSPLRKEGALNEIEVDDPAASEVIGETKSQSPAIDDATALEEPKNVSSNWDEGIMLEPSIDDLAVIEVLEEAEKHKDWENQGIFHCESTEKDRSSYIEAYTPDKENRTPMRSGKKNIVSKSTNRALFSDIEATDEELYPPDKENCIPSIQDKKSGRSSRHRSRLENGILLKQRREERLPLQSLLSNSPVRLFEGSNPSAAKRSSSCNQKITKSTVRLSEASNPSAAKRSGSCNQKFTKSTTRVLFPDAEAMDACKENCIPNFSGRSSRLQFKSENDYGVKERRAERVPMQSLVSNSPVRQSEASLPSVAKRNSSSISRNQKATNSNSVNSVGEKSRIWTMIADTTSLLNKETRGALELLQGLKGTHLIIPRIVMQELDSLKTEASAALEWIEECMLKTKWWIHVESSEDHILDCALFHKKSNSDGHLALLTNNVTLKVKAMAEGLVCETAREFRDSLANPFSERFLWTGSSPRGQTWSVFDDVVLKDNFYTSPSKKSSIGDSSKGLKLIMLLNS